MIPFKSSKIPKVTEKEMQYIYEKIATPKKIGAIVKWDEHFTDSPSVFKWNNKYYMYYAVISKDCNISGYETHVSVSDDLMNWKHLGPIFKRDNRNRWDSKQCAGYAAFADIIYTHTRDGSVC